MAQWLGALDALAEDPSFHSLIPRDGSQPSITLGPGDVTSSCDHLRHQAHT